MPHSLKNTSLQLLAGPLLALAAGCRSAADDPGPQSTLSATVSGGPDFEAANSAAVGAMYFTDRDTATAPGCLSVAATSGAGNYLSFRLIKCGGVGTYPLRADPASTRFVSGATYYAPGLPDRKYYAEYMLPVSAVVGEVVVTSFDKARRRVQGTFRFTGAQVQGGPPVGTPVQASNGRFDCYNLVAY